MSSRLLFSLEPFSFLSHFFPLAYVGFQQALFSQRLRRCELSGLPAVYWLGEGGHQPDPFPEKEQRSSWPIGDAQDSKRATEGKESLLFGPAHWSVGSVLISVELERVSQALAVTGD